MEENRAMTRLLANQRKFGRFVEFTTSLQMRMPEPRAVYGIDFSSAHQGQPGAFGKE